MDTGNYGSTTFYYTFTENDTYISSTDDGNPGTCTVETTTTDDGGDADVTPCPVPDGENTQFVRQALADPVGAPTASDFLQTLITQGNDDGSYIIESNNGPATDSCYYPQNSVGKVTGVTGTTWVIGQANNNYPEGSVVIPGHNQWGPDVVGYSPGATRFYQLNRPKLGLAMPCGFTIQQNLEIQCQQSPETTETYKGYNPLTSTIDLTGITNCRSNVCSPHYNYP